jgi:hypothetical protein
MGGITYTSNSMVNGAMALNGKLKNDTFLLLDIKKGVARFAFVVRGCTMGYYELPFGYEIMSTSRLVTEENLFDLHPPHIFQIDGNLGYTAAVCEMLLQSHTGVLSLLPALPLEWKTGSFRGLVARGGFSVDCAWEEGRVTRVAVSALAGGTLRIRLPRSLVPAGARTEGDVCRFSMKAGDVLVFEEARKEEGEREEK